MLTVRIILGIFCIKFVVLAFTFRKKGKTKKIFWIGLGIALCWLILLAITLLVHI